LYGACHKEAGEDVQRNVWGYFYAGGATSVWTLLIAPDEVEDNHEIAKKFRRLKQTVERMLAGAEWLSGKSAGEFMSTIAGERVRFEESLISGKGEPPVEPIVLGRVGFLTDGYGPSHAAIQVALLLEREFGVAVV
jgi:hypothetical protein